MTTVLKDKAGVIFLIGDQSREKTQTNNILVCLSIYSDFSTLATLPSSPLVASEGINLKNRSQIVSSVIT